MERPKLPKGLIWRRRPGPEGSYFEDIYFKKKHRGRQLLGSSGTADPKEAERRLRQRLQEIDEAALYGRRPDRTFNEAAEKLILEFQGSENTLLSYATQADLLSPWLGTVPLRLISKDTLKPFIAARYEQESSARTVNVAIGFVRRVLRLAAYYWRDKHTGLSWLENCPIISFEKGAVKRPVPLSWEQQAAFLEQLVGEVARDLVVFDVNTGLRETPLLHLRWEWETFSDVLGETIFEIPPAYLCRVLRPESKHVKYHQPYEVRLLKNGKPMTLILNREARRVLEKRRGAHPEYVFGTPVWQVTSTGWENAWRKAGLPQGKEHCKGVHNLRHTFGKRLRDAGVDDRDVQDLLHHAPKSVTRRYSAPELAKLRLAVEKIVTRPPLQLVGGVAKRDHEVTSSAA